MSRQLQQTGNPVFRRPPLAQTHMPLVGQRRKVGFRYSTVIADIDFETYSEAGYRWLSSKNKWQAATKGSPGLKGVGAPAYAEHPTTRPICLAYDLKDGVGPRLWRPGLPPPYELFEYIKTSPVEAWNSSFEWYIWNWVMVPRWGWPPLPLDRLRCAMSKSKAWSCPGKLEKATHVLRCSVHKDMDGSAVMRRLSVPRSPTKSDSALCYSRVEHPEDFRTIDRYCVDDIRSEAAASQALPDLTDSELEVWKVDQQINTRGVAVDVEMMHLCINIVEQATAKYTAELRAITGGAVQTVDELEKMKAWLNDHGLYMRSIDADNVEEALANKDLPDKDPRRRVLEIRSWLGARSVKKLYSLSRMHNKDHRMRDLFAYFGADRTGRFAGRGPQPQNFPSSGPKVVRCTGCNTVYYCKLKWCPCCGGFQWKEADWGIEAVEAAYTAIRTQDLNYIESMWGDSLALVSGCLRGLFCAGPGKELICSDYSAIEAVVLAMLAGEQWRIDVFKTHGKIYEMSAAAITGVSFEEFMQHKERTGDHHPLRKKVGKVAELASGYQGWIGAWKQFGADDFFDTDEEIENACRAWREASPMIVKLWKQLERAAILAIENRGKPFYYRLLGFCVIDDVLYIKLPSGRALTYHKPRIEMRIKYDKPAKAITYEGWNGNYKKGPIGWMRLDTYGGKLTENVTQAVARDILTHAMVNLEKANYPIVLHVHDETVSEVPKGWGSVKEYEAILGDLPEWAKGWPIKAAGGWRGHRYRKD